MDHGLCKYNCSRGVEQQLIIIHFFKFFVVLRATYKSQDIQEGKIKSHLSEVHDSKYTSADIVNFCPPTLADAHRRYERSFTRFQRIIIETKATAVIASKLYNKLTKLYLLV